MVRRLWWLTAVMALVISEGARAQYQGYLPVQTGGSDQVTVSVASNTWGIYTFRQQDLDTVLVGYPPNMREMQVIDTTCGVVYDLEASQPYWWVTLPRISQVETRADGTFRYRFEALSCTTTSTRPFWDHLYLINRRGSLDIFRDPDYWFVQTVYVIAVPPPQP